MVGRKKKKCVIITDSNGRDTTPTSVKNHIPKGERDNYEIDIAVSYTLEETLGKIERGAIKVDGAVVVLDCLTNNVRGTRARKAASPEELLDQVRRLRDRILVASAASVIVCEIKPLRDTNVTPYNMLISDYLVRVGPGGFGCRTQIRMKDLRADGLHVVPECLTVIDRTYACALRGVHVPCPTPLEDFVPEAERRRWDVEWPRLAALRRGGSPFDHYGWW